MRSRNFTGGGAKAGMDGVSGEGIGAIPTIDPSQSSGGVGGAAAINQMQAQIAEITSRLDAASAVCNGDGTITFTI